MFFYKVSFLRMPFCWISAYHFYPIVMNEYCSSRWHSSYCNNAILQSLILESFILLTSILQGVFLHSVILKIAILLNVNQKSLVNFRSAECCSFKSFCRVSFFEVKYTNCHALLHSVILKNIILLNVSASFLSKSDEWVLVWAASDTSHPCLELLFKWSDEKQNQWPPL
jgi:hypothetical protein